MQPSFSCRLLRLWVLCVPVVLFFASCTASRIRQQNILFRTDGAGRLDTASLRNVVNRAERNYIIQPNDFLDVRVYTNRGERILDPNGELFFGQPAGTGAGSVNRQGSGGRSAQPQRIGGQAGQQPLAEFLVQRDGVVKLPLVGTVKLSGLTLLQADSLLQTRYAEFYKEAFVTTRVTNNRIIVLGATSGGSGQIISMFNDNMNLLEVLAAAGGIEGGFAGTTGQSRVGRVDNIRLIRGDLKNPQVQVIDLTTIEGMRRANLQVEPNDIIYVEPIRRPFFESLQDAGPLFGLIGSLAGIANIFFIISQINN
ncbi:polysaccharide biosynthesis/export family protein [Hymenobacter weizhouensis]|uniref:polysaccharide biosynthesis/export family protein n=1 Tax=Hymenobacter sp. YIM 151500-1 TaxID=2987689 RepID=UPI0022274CE6|nr:polysaccharide biosynthesis/export family protein [Hymenobacter sp. YIM 151500-1]UYZ62810.1 polysaccharide biosynthesis/export family protein [Hymenobacter sp. YIM 151500-1]